MEWVVGQEVELGVSIVLNSVSAEMSESNFHNLQTYVEEAFPLFFSLFPIEM